MRPKKGQKFQKCADYVVKKLWKDCLFLWPSLLKKVLFEVTFKFFDREHVKRAVRGK